MGDLVHRYVMIKFPDVPGQAGIGTHTLSLHKVVQAFPSPILLTTTRLCRQNKLVHQFLKTASNLSSFSLSHDGKICTHRLVKSFRTKSSLKLHHREVSESFQCHILGFRSEYGVIPACYVLKEVISY